MEAALCDSRVRLMRPVFDIRGDFRLAVHDPILEQVYSPCSKPVRLNNCISAVKVCTAFQLKEVVQCAMAKTAARVYQQLNTRIASYNLEYVPTDPVCRASVIPIADVVHSLLLYPSSPPIHLPLPWGMVDLKFCAL